jgi:hypothetical protein
MASADLDTVIRKLAKQQHKALAAAVKETRTRYNALAAKARDGAARQRYKQIAQQSVEEGNAAIRRLQMSADNVADSYARAMRRVMESALSAPKPAKKKETKPAKAEAAASAPTKASKAKAAKAKAKKVAVGKKATTKKARA